MTKRIIWTLSLDDMWEDEKFIWNKKKTLEGDLADDIKKSIEVTSGWIMQVGFSEWNRKYLKQLSTQLKKLQKKWWTLNDWIKLISMYIEKYGITPDVNSVNVLILFAPNLENGQELIEKYGITPNTTTMNLLLSLVPDLKSGKELILKYWKLYNDEITWYILLEANLKKRGILFVDKIYKFFSFSSLETIITWDFDSNFRIACCAISFLNFKGETSNSDIISNFIKSNEEHMRIFRKYIESPNKIYDTFLEFFTWEANESLYEVSRTFKEWAKFGLL